MKAPRCLAVLFAALAFAPAPAPAPAADDKAARVMRYSFPAGETGFDPAGINDLYSRIVTAHIFDGLYHYDHLARPYLVRPNVAVDLPAVGADFKTWTVKIKPGIYFADDAAFKGRKRELVAQDFVYSWKRFFDPATKSPVYSAFKEEGAIGVDALRQEVLAKRGKFDYDREVEGIRALDRYTIQFKLDKPRPRFLYTLAAGDQFGAVAREVVELYGDKIMEHPVGSGPFKLGAWRRSSLIVLERNPAFRDVTYDARPNADDAEGQAIAASLKGRKLPMLDRVDINIIEASQPRWLAFLQERFDLVAVPLEYSTLAAPNGKLAPNLTKKGVRLHRIVNPDRTLYYFNMDDPLVGGYSADKVALRRAIRLGSDTQREINSVRRGQAIPAQSVIAPGTWGYDPAYKSENSDFDPARANALLDMFGYVDRDADGWRDMPDGSPLTLQYASQPDEISRQFDEIWKKNMDSIRIRLKINLGQWPEQLKKARAGQLMVWQVGLSAANPDSQLSFDILYGPSSGGQNLARFRNERYDDLFRRMAELSDGPERLALMRELQKVVDAYAPHKYNVHRIINDLTQPWLFGYRRPLFGYQFWQYVDVDPARQPKLN